MSGIVVLILRIALAAALYVFLGWAIYTLWKDLHVHSTQISAPRFPPITLTPIEDSENLVLKTFATNEVFIGRSANTDFCINKETISARHARLSYHHNQWWVEDQHSTNGTFLNDERVHTPTVIVTGDELRVGQTALLIAIEDQTA